MSEDLYTQIKKMMRRDTEKLSKKETIIRLCVGVLLIVIGGILCYLEISCDFISDLVLNIFHGTAVMTLSRVITCLLPIGVGIIILLEFIPSSKIRKKAQKFYSLFLLVAIGFAVLAAILIATGIAT